MAIDFGLGAVIGMILALTGAGGGILAVPLLVCIDGLSMLEAAPVSLFAISMASAFGAVLGLKAGIVRYRAALFLAAAGLLASPLGFWIAGKVSNAWLGFLFSMVLLAVALRCMSDGKNASGMLFSTSGKPPCKLASQSGKLVWTSACAKSLALSGAITGFLSGLIGVGGGFVVVPALRRFTDLHMHSIISTSLASIAIVSMGSAVSGAIAGHVRWDTAIPFSMGAMLGVLGTRPFAAGLSGELTRKLFALSAMLASFALLAKLFLPA